MVGRWQAVVSALLTTALLATGCATSHPSATPRTGTGVAYTIDWVPCAGTAGPKGYQCASVPVPRDPGDPAAGTIEMAIDRHRATGRKIGSLLINPGGPGVSGVDYLSGVMPLLSHNLASHFDVVGFDPPGVARSAPIVCADPAGLARYFHADPAPATAAGLTALVAEDRAFADGCEAMSRSELPYVSTVDAAKDLDVLRGYLGDSGLTYLGFSYGTFLGAQYAALFPHRVRALVLDGALDPAVPTLTSLDQQAESLDHQLQLFFTACGTSPGCPWDPSPGRQTAYQELVQRVSSSPIPVPGTNRTVGPSELLYGTANALYSPETWNQLGAALAQAQSGDGTGILSLFDSYTERNSDGTYRNVFEANAAVDCLDAPAPTVAAIEKAAVQAEALAPIFGAANLYGQLSCSVWPVKATGHVGPLRAPGAPPILVVGSTGDPITPYSWARGLASELGSGVLLTRVGDGHTAYPYSRCVRSAVDAYLVDLNVPPAGTTCPSD
jgi:pimeloyl-ACP methyl ester carboxylesterase